MEILDRVLAEVKPSKKEEGEVFKAASEFAKLLKPRFRDADVFLGGSIAKGTWLKGNYDMDVFIRFGFRKFQGAQLSDLLEKELKKLKLKYQRIHGSRDYFSVSRGKLKFEVVPILKINSAEKARNITDISPLHVIWVRKKITGRLADEVRLLKAFCHAQNLYGAESHIRGFSGYACEVLIAYAGSFLNLMKNTSHWPGREIIDVEKHYKGRNPLKELNRAKIESPLILIDPVQSSRNISAALNEEKYRAFVESSKKFLKKPSIDFFRKKQITSETLRKNARGRKLVIIHFRPIGGREDIVASKVLKAFEHAETGLRKQFRVYQSGWSFEDSLIWFYCGKKPLPEYEEIIGPPLDQAKDVQRFRQRHKATFTKGKRIVAREKRKHRLPQALLESLAGDPYVLSRVSLWRVE